MSPNAPQFESLRERLLRGGISPRAVRRYLRELHEHYDDVLRAEIARGASRATAERTAWQRLGSEDDLLRSALARPELRATGARRPAAIYGAGPLVLWLGAVVLTVTVLGVAAAGGSAEGSLQPGWFRALASALCLLCARVLPVAISGALLIAAFRQRLAPRWPLIGAALVALLAGTTRIDVTFADAIGAPNRLSLSSSLVSLLAPAAEAVGPLDAAELSLGLARAALMLALTALPYHLVRQRQERQRSA